MLELDTLWRIIDEGSTPVIAVIAYLIWRLDKTLNAFIVKVNAKQKERDDKINSIHTDMNSFIRKLADMEKQNNA